MTPFELWMQSLDPSKLAAESFHSAQHRKTMKMHELNKLNLQVNVTVSEGLLARHERSLAQVAEIWAVRDARDTPTKTVIKPKVSVRTNTLAPNKTEPTFTTEQLRIATNAIGRKEA